MKHKALYRIHRTHSACLLLLALLFLLVACTRVDGGGTTQPTGPLTPDADSVATGPSPTAPNTSLTATTVVGIVLPTLVPTVTDVVATSVPSPTATPSLSSTDTNSPIPTPTVATIACVDGALELEKGFPGSADLQMQDSRTFFDGNFVYLAAQNYLGLVDTSAPVQPRFYGFWQLPQPGQTTDILTHDGVLYVSFDSTVQLLNLNPACRLSPIAQLELPFNATRMEIENNRLYVAGTNDQLNTEQLAIFAIQSPTQLEQVGLLDLGAEPVRWSVMQNEVFVLSGVELGAIDVSEPAAPVSRSIDVMMDTEFLIRQNREMIDNAFYYYSSREGLNVVRNLDQIPPSLQTTAEEHALNSVTREVIDSMQIDQSYIFLGSNWCDGDCASIVNVVDRESFAPLAVLGLQPHYPVHHYVEITDEVFYAFSDNQLLVIDISDPKAPSIIQTVPLTR